MTKKKLDEEVILKIDIYETRQYLNEQIKLGEEVYAKMNELRISAHIAYKDFNEFYDKSPFREIKEQFFFWYDAMATFLERSFSTKSIAKEFDKSYKKYTRYSSRSLDRMPAAVCSKMMAGIWAQVDYLKNLCNKLEIYCMEYLEEGYNLTEAQFLKDIFIVHGTDEKAKHEKARFISHLGLNPIILHEQPNQGRTLIEKFEAHSVKAAFAVILLTPDDIGYPHDNLQEKKPRARQNVIGEMFYFIGKLGRERVAMLYNKGVELPSDIHGMIYIPIDNGDWKIQLAKEMRNSGLNFDGNRLLEQ